MYPIFLKNTVFMYIMKYLFYKDYK